MEYLKVALCELYFEFGGGDDGIGSEKEVQYIGGVARQHQGEKPGARELEERVCHIRPVAGKSLVQNLEQEIRYIKLFEQSLNSVNVMTSSSEGMMEFEYNGKFS